MKILIVKIGAIGDALIARTMLGAVPQGSEVSWLCGKSVAPLVRRFPGVSEVIEMDDEALLRGDLSRRLRAVAGIWLRLAGRYFDLVVTGHSDARYGLLSWTVRSAQRRSFASHPLVRGRFHGDEYIRLIHGVEGPVVSSLSYAPIKARKPGVLKGGRWVLLFPGGAKNLLRDDAVRRWPLQHYAVLAKLLKKGGWKVAFSGAPSDDWVRSAMLSTGALDLVGRFDLHGTIGLCAEASRVVTHDSGPMHLAAASGARVTALFGPTLPSEMAVGYHNVTVLWGGERLACRPCYNGKDYAPCQDNQCLGELSPARVAASLVNERAR